jgi:hypothetical protein
VAIDCGRIKICQGFPITELPLSAGTIQQVWIEGHDGAWRPKGGDLGLGATRRFNGCQWFVGFLK